MPLTKVVSSMLASGASGSGGSTGKNYISTYNNNTCNGDFESGAITGWSVCSVSSITNGVPSGAPTIISSPGAGDPALSLLSSGQIAGQYSLQAVFPAGSLREGFISDIFTIDTEDQAKVLTFKFYYNVTSGASNGNFSGTSSNTFIVAIYAVNGTNAGWIQPAGLYAMTQSSGGAGIATGTFQTYSDTTQYRFAILCAVAPTPASITITFDDFSVGPLTAPIGPVVSDWVSYTPTGGWGSPGNPIGGNSNATYTGRYRRVGDSMEVQFAVSLSGAPNNANLTINLPSGFTTDLSKLAAGSIPDVLGSGQGLKSGTGYIFGIYLSTSTAMQVSYIVNGTTSAEANVGQTTPVVWASGDSINGSFRVPIAGWSSNVQLSNDTDTRVVAASVANSTSTLAITTSDQVLPFNVITTDTHGAYSTSTNFYTIPVSGVYTVTANILYNVTGFTGNSAIDTGIALAGGGNLQRVRTFVAASTFLSGVATYTGPFTAGQQIYVLAAKVNTACTANFHNDASFCRFSVQRISGPSVIAATETVALKRTSTSAAQINSSVATYVDFPTADVDTHNAWVPSSGVYNPATGTWATQNPVYRVPVSGLYFVSANVGFQSAIMAGVYCSLTLIKNGIGFADGSSAPNTTAIQYATSGSGLVRCVAGDLIGVYIFQDSGGARNLQNYGAPRTQISITRVGN